MNNSYDSAFGEGNINNIKEPYSSSLGFSEDRKDSTYSELGFIPSSSGIIGENSAQAHIDNDSQNSDETQESPSLLVNKFQDIWEHDASFKKFCFTFLVELKKMTRQNGLNIDISHTFVMELLLEIYYVSKHLHPFSHEKFNKIIRMIVINFREESKLSKEDCFELFKILASKTMDYMLGFRPDNPYRFEVLENP